MNKLLLLPTILATLHKSLNFTSFFNAPARGRTPNIPHSKRQGVARPHAPADGRWHMKFHRGRV